MFALPDSWVWDFWLVDDGDLFHMFFLYASRALQDPGARHHRASIGHAVSTDLREWSRVQDALVRSDPPAFDDLATWTGSIVRHPDGTWHLFYTGATLRDGSNVQSIGHATSVDLMTWERRGQVLSAGSQWYETLADGQWHDEAFRDPWVFRDGDRWRMLITARANNGPADDRGVIGTATSTDLLHWDLEPPLSEPGAGFGQLEVMEEVEIDASRFLIFNCLANELAEQRRATGTTGGVWAAPACGARPGHHRWDLGAAVQLTGDDLYVGRVIRDRSGRTVILAFRNEDSVSGFVGTITDPAPIRLIDGRPAIVREG